MIDKLIAYKALAADGLPFANSMRRHAQKLVKARRIRSALICRALAAEAETRAIDQALAQLGQSTK